MDTEQIAALPDAELRQVIVENIRVKDSSAALWEVLTSPPVVERTHRALAELRQQTEDAMGRRRHQLEESAQQWLRQGHQGRLDYQQAKAEFEDWRQKTAHLIHLVSRRAAQVNTVRKAARTAARAAAADAASVRRRDERHALRLLAQAVRRHQAVLHATPDAVRQADRELWKTLGMITVSRQGEDVPLLAMLDTAWNDPGLTSGGHPPRSETSRLAGRGPSKGAAHPSAGDQPGWADTRVATSLP